MELKRERERERDEQNKKVSNPLREIKKRLIERKTFSTGEDVNDI
jgi:hypothetical protein